MQIKCFPRECVIAIYLSILTNRVLHVLVPYHNILWLIYFDCTRGCLRFDMLVAIVSVRNNDTCLFMACSAGD